MSNLIRNFEDQTLLRLFLEEICCDLCRFHHVAADGADPADVRVDRELDLEVEGAFADIFVRPPNRSPYFVEVKYGLTSLQIKKLLASKYGPGQQVLRGANKVIVLTDLEDVSNRGDLHGQLSAVLRPELELEIWGQEQLLRSVHEFFEIDISDMSLDDLLNLRRTIDNAKWMYAFGEAHTGSRLQASLLWHFDYWRLRQLHEKDGLKPSEILPPGCYQRVVVLLADLCSFSSYVRDTRSDAVIRNSLSTFYSNARYAVINSGGMLYEFVGDEVIGLFGMPDHQQGYCENALECARKLADIGNSVSNHWQRQLDRIQSSSGVHIGIGMGDLEVVSLRPFGRAHMGAIGDAINLGTRLMSEAGSSEIIVSNTFYQNLDERSQNQFELREPVDARNVGRIRAWKLRCHKE